MVGKIYTLYKLTFPSNKSYIGITSKTVDERFKNHVSKSKKTEKYAISRAIKKYGKDSVVIETLIIGDKDYIIDLESKAIKLYNTQSPNGYNITSGGLGTAGLPQYIKDIKRDGIVSYWSSLTIEEKIEATKTQVAAMNLSLLNPVIESSRRNKISVTMTDKGIALGSKNNGAILNEEQVLEIKKLLQENIKPKFLCIKYNCSKSTISSIKHGSRWGHLNLALNTNIETID